MNPNVTAGPLMVSVEKLVFEKRATESELLPEKSVSS